MVWTYRHTRRSCYVSYIVQAVISNLMPLLLVVFQRDFHFTYNQLGILLSMTFLVMVAVGTISIRFIDGVGYRRCMVEAHLLVAVGLILMGLLPTLFPTHAFPALLVAVFIYATGGGQLEVMVSPVVNSLPQPEEGKAAAMSLLHAFYCWGQVVVVLLSTLLLQLVGSVRWYFLPLIWAVIPLANTFLMAKVPFVPPLKPSKQMGLRGLVRAPIFWVSLLVMLCAGASEMVMSQWASLFAEQGLGVSKVVGDLAGLCVFGLFMGIGRTAYGIWGAKIRLLNCMAVLTAACIGCYLLASLSQHPIVALAACGLTGLSVSILWPGTFSLSAARFPAGGTTLFACLAVFGNLGASLGPWVAGSVADHAHHGTWSIWFTRLLGEDFAGLRAGILVGVFFPILLLFLLLPQLRQRG